MRRRGRPSALPPWRTTTLFFVIVIAWAVLTGATELIAGIRGMRGGVGSIPTRTESRDGVVIGALTLVFAAATLIVSPEYSLSYTIEEAGTFELTGTIIAVGVLGFYTAIVAVYLGIALIQTYQSCDRRIGVFRCLDGALGVWAVLKRLGWCLCCLSAFCWCLGCAGACGKLIRAWENPRPQTLPPRPTAASTFSWRTR